MEFVDFTKDDLPELLEFYGKYLNQGDRIFDSMREVCGKGGYYGSKAVEDGKTCGYFTMRHGFDLTYPHPDLEREIKEASENREIDTVDALIVIPEGRNKGVGSKLAERTAGLIKKKNRTLFLAENWIYPDGSIPSIALYESMGKVVWKKEVPDFYSESHKYGILCPVCGKICRCGAMLELISVA